MNVASAPFVVDHRVADDERQARRCEEVPGVLLQRRRPAAPRRQRSAAGDRLPAEIDAAKQSALKSALDVATEPGLTSPESQPDLLFSTAVSSAIYDSIYGVIQDQFSPQEAAEPCAEGPRRRVTVPECARRTRAHPEPPGRRIRRHRDENESTMDWVSTRWKIALMLAPAARPLHRVLRLPRGVRDRLQLHRLGRLRRRQLRRPRQLPRPDRRPVLLAVAPQHRRDPRVSLAFLVPASFALALLLRQRVKRGGGPPRPGLRSGHHRADPGRPDLGVHPRPHASACSTACSSPSGCRPPVDRWGCAHAVLDPAVFIWAPSALR